MTISYGSLIQSQTLASQNSITVNYPNGYGVGNLLVAKVRRSSSGNPTSVSSGWTLETSILTGTPYVWIYCKIVQPGDTGSVTFSWSTNSYIYVEISRYTGEIDLEDPITIGSSSSYRTNDTYLRASSVTAPVNDCLAVFLGESSSISDVTIPSGYSQHLVQYYDGQLHCLASKIIQAGATGVVNGTLSSSSINKTAILVCINKGATVYNLPVGTFDLDISMNNIGMVYNSGIYELPVGQFGLNISLQDIGFNYIPAPEHSLSNFNYNSIDTYNLYRRLIQPTQWPQGGPYAEQEIPVDRLKIIKTPTGIVNLQDSILINNIEENVQLRFSKDYISEGFLVYDGSGASFTEEDSTFDNDKSIKFNHGDYIYKQQDGPFKDDIVFELIFKPVNDYIFKIGDFDPSYLLVEYQYATQNIRINLNDHTDTLLTLDTTQNSILTSGSYPFYHIMVFIGGRDSSLNSTKYYHIYINGQLDSTGTYVLNGTIDSLGDDSKAKIGDLGYNYITSIKYWSRYNWFNNDTSQIGSLALDRYTRYITGQEDSFANIDISAYTFGDSFGSIPLICIQDMEDNWTLLFDGTTGSNYKEGTITGGIKNIRLFQKYEIGRCYFDDIKTFGQRIQKIQIPKKYEMIVKKIIAQSKPLGTWAVLMIEWI